MLKIIPFLLLASTCAYGQINPVPMTKDSRIKQVFFDAHDVVNITGVDLITTSVEFDESESILDVVIGDSGAWSIDRAHGRSFLLYLKPLRQDSDTNMQVVTNKRIYEFRLQSNDEVKPQDITYRLRFNYPNDLIETKAKESEDYIPSYKNVSYSFTGSGRVAPIEAFDDLNFTYFKFQGYSLPAIFTVNANRKEELVNYRLENDYVVVEKTSGQFTIRDADLVATVVNHHYLQGATYG